MIIKLAKFGEILTSRPAGHDAYLSAQAYQLAGNPDTIEIDFAGVKVLTPSWFDEFISPMIKKYGRKKIIFLKSDNPSVKASLETLSFLSTRSG